MNHPVRNTLLALLLGACGLVAGDATGTWSGTLSPAGSDEKPAFLMLKQDGAKLTGSVGPDASEQFPIEEGKVEGSRLTFHVPSKSMRFELNQEGEEITGQITREHDGEKQTARLAVKRQK